MIHGKPKRVLISVSFLVAAFLVLLPIAGPVAAILLAMLWFEKMISALSHGMLAEAGIEFTTVPMIYLGVLYGPLASFVIGFIGMPLLDSVKWFIAPPRYSGSWPPLIPGPDTFVDGLTAGAAGILIRIFPFTVAAPLAVVARNIMAPIKDMAAYGQPPKPTLIINVIFNVYLVGLLSFAVGL